jgi:hypothetical protein
MAENEMLDVGSPRRYKKWRHSVEDAAPADSADCLYEEFSAILKKELRREPLHAVLTACGRDRAALREVVATFKNRSLARMVETAYRIAGSSDPTVVARKLAELLFARVMSRCNRYFFRRDQQESRRIALETAAIARFDSCKAEVIGWLAASLQNQPIRRTQRAPKPATSATVLVSASLLQLQKESS